MRFQPLKIFFMLMLYCNYVAGQQANDIDSISSLRIFSLSKRTYQSNDTIWIYSGICKVLYRRMLVGQSVIPVDSIKESSRPSSITFHGNIQYDFLYRSFADTPYYQKDFRQHTLRTSLEVTIKEQYPLRVNLVIRRSNSPFFRNFIDAGVLFDRLNYYKNLRQQLLTQYKRNLPGLDLIDKAKEELEKQLEKLRQLKLSMGESGLTQRLIEEREKAFLKRKQIKIPANIDSLKGELDGIKDFVADKKRVSDSLAQQVANIKARIDSMEKVVASGMASFRQKLNAAKNPRELLKISKANGLQKYTDKWQTVLANFRTIGIGRSIINYSELTANNLTLTGINAEYNSGLYVAVAAGKIDYGFRDFFGRNTRRSGQNIMIGRIGIGDIDRKAIILSVFNGQRLNYGYVMSDSVNGKIPVTGYSLEAIIKKNEFNSLSIEVAKSTRPFSGTSTDKDMGSLFQLSDKTNLGVSIKGQTRISETDTKLSGLYRKTGEKFQSFSLYSLNTGQAAWMIRADQSFFKDKISLTGIIRRNDFINPFTEKTFKTTTTFSSVQLTARIPKWPSLSVGYFPGSQLYIIDRDRVRENVYYMINGSLLHQYKAGGVRMISSAIYNQYISRGTDSGFINYSGTNYMLSQSIVSRKTQWQVAYTFTDQEELRFHTLEGSGDFSLKDWLRMSGGLKLNKVIQGASYWGAAMGFELGLKSIGSLRLDYDKSFLPTIQQTLFPVEMGRLTWTKIF